MPNTNNLHLYGRKIIITGAASGIGFAVARLFEEQGSTLFLLDLNTKGLGTICQSPRVFAMDVDVTSEQAVAKAVAAAADVMGGIDGIVNAAGIIRLGALEDTQLGDWQSQFDVNVTGPFMLCRAALPWLRAAATATIVNIASAQALRPAGASAGYAASKAALVTLSKALAAELAPSVRVNAVCPGIVDTPMVRQVNASAGKPDTTPSLKDYALGRMANADEIAAAILFLTGSDSSFITGIAMAVDGGRSFH